MGCARSEAPCVLCGRAGEQNDQATMQVGVVLNQPLSSWENFLLLFTGSVITKIGVWLHMSFIYFHLYHFYSLSSALFKNFSLYLAPPMFSHCDLPSSFIIFTFISLYFISFTFIYFGFIYISYSFIFITAPLSTHCYLYLAFFNFLKM